MPSRTHARIASSWMLIPVLALAFATAGAAESTSALLERARALHSRILVLDAHVDVLLPDTPVRYGDGHGGSQASIDKLRTGGVSAVVLALAVGPGARDAEGVRAARAEVDAKLVKLKQFVADSGNAAVIARSATEIEAARKAGRIAVIPGFLNARSLGKDLTALDALYRDGVRVFGLTHAGHNDWADSSRPGDGPAQEHGGLSPLGRQAIAKLNDLGIVVDVSQLTPAGVGQVLAITRTPVIASHSGVRALVENTRNLSDAELDAIGKNGGIVHVPAFNAYLRPAPGRAGVKELVDHVEYIVKRIGIDHVGIGTDFNHGSGIEGFEDESQAPNVTAELLRRGYTDEQITKLWGGNLLRVLREVEAARKS